MTQKAIVRLALALLAGTFALSAWMARQAVVSADAHRALAVRAVRDHATFAAWQAAQAARTEISAAHYGAFLALLSELRERPTALLDHRQLAELVNGQQDVCACTQGIRFFFTADPEGRLDAGGGDTLAQRWVRDTIARTLKATPNPGQPSPTPIRSISGLPRRLAVLITNSTPGSIYGRSGGASLAIVYFIARDSAGAPVRVYGFVSDAASFARPIFTRVLAHQQLLPPALLGSLAPEALIALTVTDPTGAVLYRPRATMPDSFAATETLIRSQGALRLHLALNPVLADRMIGGLPDSRLGTLAGVLLLSGGMILLVWLTLQRQQALVRLRDDFVGSVSHELRTPLAQIRLMAELLHRGREIAAERRERSARIIDKEARRLSFLVENLLMFARSGKGRATIAPVPCEVVGEVHEIVDAFTPLVELSGTTIELQADRQVSAAVDPAALRQIMLNLLDNAHKFGPQGQTIVVSVRQVAGLARIAVEDGGPGVPREERRRIFEPYHRMRREREGAVGGMGIGLAVVSELTAQHGGRVFVEEGARGGARFVVALRQHWGEGDAFDAREPDARDEPFLPTPRADTQPSRP